MDDGDGYVEGEKRWRFIGAYLIYGQWKQAVLGGIRNLAAAYVITGERIYAHKAAVLLDRVADLYPRFDFGTQGVMTGTAAVWLCLHLARRLRGDARAGAGLRPDPGRARRRPSPGRVSRRKA